MIVDKQLIFLKTVEGLDYYEFKPRFLRYYYTPMAYYEGLFSRIIRESFDYIRGGYRVFYFGEKDKLIGYVTIVKGGGRYRFCTSCDSVFCNLFILDAYRGKGYSSKLISLLSQQIDRKLYAFIRHDNYASIRCFERLGYTKVFNAEYKLFHFVVLNAKGHLGVYTKENA